jgi:hypothetical protein
MEKKDRLIKMNGREQLNFPKTLSYIGPVPQLHNDLREAIHSHSKVRFICRVLLNFGKPALRDYLASL